MPAIALFLAIERRALAAGRTPLVNVTVIRRPAIRWGLVALAGSSGTYFALLFTLAQYLQIGLGRSALFSGLILLPWVAAFGLAGQLRRHIPARFAAAAPVAGLVLLAAVYLAIGITALEDALSTPLVAVLFIPGGFGLGTVFTGLLGHLTSAAPREQAADISGVSATTSQLGASIGVAGFGAVYFSLVGGQGADHSFGLTALAFAATALIATVPAYLSTRSR